MKRKLRKLTAGVLTALMIAGSVQLVPMEQVQAQGGYSETVSGGDAVISGDTVDDSNTDESFPDGAIAAVAAAAGEAASDGIMALAAEDGTQLQEVEYTYTISELPAAGGYGYDKMNNADGGITLTYTQGYGEIRFAIPEEIDVTHLKKMVVNATDYSSLALKFLISKDAYDNDNIAKVDYSCSELSAEGIAPEKLNYIAFMNTVDGFSTTINKVTFVVEEEASPKLQEVEHTYTISELSAAGGYGYDKTDNADGGITLTYTQNYGEIRFAIPEEIDVTRLKKMVVNATDYSSLALKFLISKDAYDNDNIAKVDYSCSELSAEGVAPEKLNYIAFMNTVDGFVTTINSVTFVVMEESTGKEPEYEIVTYSVAGDNLTFTGRWNGASASMPYTFSGNYEEIWFQLPEAVDMDRCVEVTFTVSDQGGAICFKLYDSGGTSLKDFYDCSGSTEYVKAPGVSGKVTAVGIMSNDEKASYPFSVNFVSVSFKLTAGSGEEEPPKNVPFDENLIKNPDFADVDNLDVWSAESNGAVISSETAVAPIYGNVKTYGKITGRTSNYQCFAQDVTEILEKGQEYQFSFWVMLDPNDYKDAPASQRTVEISPYITANGSTSYGAGVSGTTRQAITPGKWVQFTGTYKPTWSGTLGKAVIRILEQGEDYGGGEGVQGTYYVTGVDLRKLAPVQYEIEQDIPNLKDSITAVLGSGTIVGTAATASEMNDEILMQLVEKHFNALTLGNELKLDAMLNYNSTKPLETETVTFNGKELVVPVLNYSRADGMLDQILAWNSENPQSPIKVRGHVLVWHSQAPTAFFRENYDPNGAYVSKTVMDQRLEWYIKTMLEYYTGSTSPYKDLFYGWDVVNEAINDGTATYRSASESDWAAVYGSQSNEYIIKAFRWANQYAPKSLELYYNDYNDSTPTKRDGIVKLLKAVKAAEGTRIDGMGMQAHYDMSSPSVAQFKDAARAYAAVVGKVQLTELDLKASSSYDGTAATREDEYLRQAYRYKDFYDAIKELKVEGVNVTGITIWGVVDKYSWLQDSSNVGGGSDGSNPQCPLLFDDAYKAKPAYWAFVDPSKLEPPTQKLTVLEDVGKGYDTAEKYSFGNDSVNVQFRPLWKNNTLKVQVTVTDATVDDNDSITLYIDAANAKAVGIKPQKVTVNRKDATAISGGYQAELSINLSGIAVAKKIGFDIRVTNGNTLVSYNDLKNTQDTSSKYYAEATFKPYALIGNGTAVVDGTKEAVWTTNGKEIPLTINLGSQVSATVTALWDEEYLYVFAEVKDAVLNNASGNAHEQDSLEVFIDENNHKSDSYEADDKQYRISYTNDQSFNGTKCVAENVTSVAKVTADGYVIEAAYKWTDITPKAGTEIGFELQINDADATGSRIGTLSWYDETGMGWSSPGVYGTVKLVGEEPESSESPAPDQTPSSQTGGSTSTPEPSAAPASTRRPASSASSDEEFDGPVMPDEIKGAVNKLSRLLESNASERQKLNAVKEILEVVRKLAEEDNLNGFTKEAIEYTEDLISRALNKQVQIEYVGAGIPAVSKVIGALLSVGAEKEARLVVDAVEVSAAPEISEEYVKGYVLDIKLLEDGVAIQPLVPITIRMKLPDQIDRNLAVKVLHYSDGADQPEVLDVEIIGDEMEFTTTSFSIFVVVNVADNRDTADETLDSAEEVESGGQAAAPDDQIVVNSNKSEKSGSRVAVIIIVVIVAILVIAAGAFLAIKAKKEDN